jgi:hypothetical protein
VPVLAGDDLYVLDRLTVFCRSPTDGTERWTVGYDEAKFDASNNERLFATTRD